MAKQTTADEHRAQTFGAPMAMSLLEQGLCSREIESWRMRIDVHKNLGHAPSPGPISEISCVADVGQLYAELDF